MPLNSYNSCKGYEGHYESHKKPNADKNGVGE